MALARRPMSPPLPPELLMTHAGALRSMARALLGDEHAAEDVVQETWVRALSVRPSTDRGLGGWLRGVAEGFALQRRRSEGRRAARERAYASERVEALDSDRRSTVLRAVMEAVLALDEPYRETVLLRWFEGLPPRAIAERLGVRVATIDSRLQRAHARLRARLERELGDGERDWRAIVAVALGAPSRDASVLATSTLPLIGVAVSLKLVGAALAAVVGVCLWLGWDRTRPPVVEPVSLVAPRAAGADGASLAVTDTEAGRELAVDTARAEVATAATTSTEPTAVLAPGPYAFTLRVDVVDSAELPIHGADVYLGPASGAVVHFGETGWDGVLEREWRCFEPMLSAVLYVRGAGQATSLRRVEIAAGARTALRFQMDPSPPVLTVAGSRLVSFSVGSAGVPLRPDEFTLDAAGNGIFEDSQLARIVATPAAPPMSTTSGLDETQEVGDVVFEATSVGIYLPDRRLPADDAPEPPAATVRGVVRDEDGRPLAGLVVHGRTPDRWNTGVPCDADGAFVFTDVPPGRMEVIVGGDDRDLVREAFELAPGESRFLELRPRPRPTVHVRLVDADDVPLREWTIEARSGGPDAATVGLARTDEHGVAVLGLAVDGPLQFYARPSAWKATAAMRIGACDPAGKKELRFQTPTAARAGSITFTVDDARGVAVDARAWRGDSGEGITLGTERAEDDDAGSPTTVRARALLPGSWRVEWRTPGSAWSELGRFEVEPGQDLDLGSVLRPAASRVTLRAADPKPASVRLSLRAQIDGATVVWPEREFGLPGTIETLSAVPIEVLWRALEGDAPPSLPLHDPLRLGAGGVAIDLTAPR